MVKDRWRKSQQKKTGHLLTKIMLDYLCNGRRQATEATGLSEELLSYNKCRLSLQPTQKVTAKGKILRRAKPWPNTHPQSPGIKYLLFSKKARMLSIILFI